MSSPIQIAFDAAYQNSLPPAVRNLENIGDFDQRVQAAATLAAQGYTIDVPIQVWGWDPYLVMKNRSDYGYTWVPSALQPPPGIAPGVSQPGTPSYDPAHPPAGSIKVSTNITDYPPFITPPVVTSTNPADDLVGAESIGNIYLTIAGDHSPLGTKFTNSRGEFVKQGAPTPFGVSTYWLKIG